MEVIPRCHGPSENDNPLALLMLQPMKITKHDQDIASIPSVLRAILLYGYHTLAMLVLNDGRGSIRLGCEEGPQ